jgi:hypothetical protein
MSVDRNRRYGEQWYKRSHRVVVETGMVTLIPDGACRWRIEAAGEMRVPGVIFAAEGLLPDAPGDQALQQVVNVASLPGIVEASYAMPDVHWGYGFPIGGVAATDPSEGGVVSPVGWGSTSPAASDCSSRTSPERRSAGTWST